MVEITEETVSWLRGVFPYDCRALEPKLWNTFTRMTMVSKHGCERVTIDVDLTFNTDAKIAYLDGIAIAEVKMDTANHASPFLLQMRAQRIRPQGFQ